jgi:hypothetical protein
VGSGIDSTALRLPRTVISPRCQSMSFTVNAATSAQRNPKRANSSRMA